VRQKLGSVICQTLASPAGDLHVLTFDPAIENTIVSGIKAVETAHVRSTSGALSRPRCSHLAGAMRITPASA